MKPRYLFISIPIWIFCISLLSAIPPTPYKLPLKLPGQMKLSGDKIPIVMDTSFRCTGTIFIPSSYKPRKEGLDILIHFHTQNWLVEQEFLKSGRKAVIVVINFPGLSSVYRIPFQTDTTLFQQILDQTITAATTKYPNANTAIRTLGLSSFSAGYAAIREIVKQPAYFEKINDVLLADSLYAGITDTTSRTLVTEDVDPFIPLMQDAVKGNKIFISTYCSIKPDTFASTPETNAYLISIAGGEPKTYPVDTSNTGILCLKFDKGNYHVQGYTGELPVSHTSHIYVLRRWYNFFEVGRK